MVGGVHDFPLQPGMTVVNHASYGLATRRSLAIAGEIRDRFEGDSMREFAELVTAHRAAARVGAQFTGLTDGEFALTANTTAGASAVTASLALTPGSSVVVLGTEYPSVIRAWEIAAARSGATLHVLRVPLPITSTDDLVERLDAEVSGGVDVLQASLVTSGSALVLDLAALGRWIGERGGRLIVDAAHGPGHVACGAIAEHAAIAFGTLHKWLPVPRGVGFLWTAPGTPETLEAVRGAMNDAKVRPWLGTVNGYTVLRLSTHVHSTEADVERVLEVVRAIL